MCITSRCAVVVVTLFIGMGMDSAVAGTCNCKDEIDNASASTTDACSKVYSNNHCTLEETGAGSSANRNDSDRFNNWLDDFHNRLSDFDIHSYRFDLARFQSTPTVNLISQYQADGISDMIVDALALKVDPSFAADMVYVVQWNKIDPRTFLDGSISNFRTYNGDTVEIGGGCISGRSNGVSFVLNTNRGPVSCD